MLNDVPADWPARRRMPSLESLDEDTRRMVMDAVSRLRDRQEAFGDRFLSLARAHLPEYGILTDHEVRGTATQFMETFVAELSSLRVPDDALRERLRTLAVERTARGIPPETQAAGYQMGSRAMLAFLDEVGAEVGLPPALMLAVHDSTWEFSNEAAAMFSRVQHELAVERAHFDAERRATFAGGVLRGTLPSELIDRDAHLFGLDPRELHIPVAALAPSPADGSLVRRAIASSLRMPAERLLFAQIGSRLGGIIPKSPPQLAGYLVAVGPAVPLRRLHEAFAEATLALDTAAHFAQTGVVRLADLGPRPLVLASPTVVRELSARHLHAFDGPGRSNHDIEETARVYLECDQQVRDVARRLAVHPNTVRYRVRRFQELTDLDLRRTEDLVTAWWLLNCRRSDTDGSA